MLLLIASIALAEPASANFPERVPGLMQACLLNAVEKGQVTQTEESQKYICVGEPAERLWAFLEEAKVASFEQDVPEGRWLSRDFPLGGCFKRVRLPDGSPAETGLSCTIWIPRPTQ